MEGLENSLQSLAALWTATLSDPSVMMADLVVLFRMMVFEYPSEGGLVFHFVAQW
jgi:hypothetical protein